MKTTLLLLLTLTAGFASFGQTPQPAKAKPKVKMLYSNKLFDLTTGELTLRHLRTIYGKAFKINRVTRNIHDPAVRDTVLAANVTGDKVEIFTNQYNSFLIKANITSQRIAFGRSIRIGATKSSFCKALGLPATFDRYQILSAEGGSDIFFLFQQGVLASVTYQIGDTD